MATTFELRLVLSFPVPEIDDDYAGRNRRGYREGSDRRNEGLSSSEVRDLRQRQQSEYERSFEDLGELSKQHGGAFSTERDHYRKVRRDPFEQDGMSRKHADVAYWDGGPDVPTLITAIVTVVSVGALRAILADAREIVTKWIEASSGRSARIKFGDTEVEITGSAGVDKVLAALMELERSNSQKRSPLESNGTPAQVEEASRTTESHSTHGPASVFISYARADDVIRVELGKHLSVLERQGLVSVWQDRMIGAGREWEGAIDEKLETADIVLLLISADFVHSPYCFDVEMKRALERHHTGKALVIPVMLRPVLLHGLPFAKLQALPKDAKPASEWASMDLAFVDITKGLRDAIVELWTRLPNSDVAADEPLSRSAPSGPRS